MKIAGLQKCSLLDFPDRLAAIVWTPGCPFRCPFCHNPSLVLNASEIPLIPESEFFDFLKSRVGKLEGVCVTGGEPLMQADLPDFLRKIRELGFAVKLDTNGAFPNRLARLIADGLLDYAAMDIKNAPDVYGQTAGLSSSPLNDVCRSAEILMKSGLPYEFRTTVVREFHSVERIQKIGERLAGAEKYFLQNFKNSGKIISSQPLHSIDFNELEMMKKTAERYFGSVEIR